MHTDWLQHDCHARPLPARRFLTHDEEVRFPSRTWHNYRYRVRVWRGRDATPVVLASPVTDSTGLISRPQAVVPKIANYAIAALAGYPECSILYYDHEPPDAAGQCQLRQLHFEYYGSALRLRLFRPVAISAEWGRLEYIVGEPIER